MPSKAKQDARRLHLISLGLEPDVKTWSYKWRNLRNRSDCSLTFEQYTQLASEAGLQTPDQIDPGGFHMGRIGDTGRYEMGNCRFIHYTQNGAERTLNGGTARIAEGLKNKPKSKTAVDKISKRFRMVDPNGKVFEGVNISEFCRVHNLHQPCVCMVCRGKARHHRGWTGEYLE